MKSHSTIFLAALLLLLGGCAVAGTIPVNSYRVVQTTPHDTGAFTEGLFYLDGHLYESTGMVGESSIRKVDLASGEVMQKRALPPPDYGEGIIAWGNRLIELTWKSGYGYIYNLETFEPIGRFEYAGEGWSLTRNDSHIFMSDGTANIRVLDPESLKVTRLIHVTAGGKPVLNLNELEWVKGQLYANVWMTNHIARIDPETGHVVGWIDLTGLGPKPDETGDPYNDVLNGIAYDAKGDRLFVTGKRWPKIFQIRLTKPKGGK